MRRNPFCLLILLGLFSTRLAFGAEAAKTGVVKGSITIEGRPTADVVVSIEGLPEEILKSHISDPKTKRAVMEQREKRFIPHILPVQAGTVVEFPNYDTSWHNVYSASEAKRFDLGLYPPGKTRSVIFDESGVLRILCNVHPRMEAYVVVKEHPYFDVPDKRGNYQLGGVPLGKYRLEIWHPELGKRVEPFNLVREGEVLAVDIDLHR